MGRAELSTIVDRQCAGRFFLLKASDLGRWTPARRYFFAAFRSVGSWRRTEVFYPRIRLESDSEHPA